MVLQSVRREQNTLEVFHSFIEDLLFGFRVKSYLDVLIHWCTPNGSTKAKCTATNSYDLDSDLGRKDRRPTTYVNPFLVSF